MYLSIVVLLLITCIYTVLGKLAELLTLLLLSEKSDSTARNNPNAQELLFPFAGGLAAVIYTDTLQTAVMTIGAIILCIISK